MPAACCQLLPAAGSCLLHTVTVAARLFLLSPASCAGNRARLLLTGSSRFALAERVRAEPGAPLGEVFAFISQLYFRGKLAYGRAYVRVPQSWSFAPRRGGWSFAPSVERGSKAPRVERGSLPPHLEGPPRRSDGVFVITTSRGLVPWHWPVSVETLREFAAIEMRLENDAYTRPLQASALAIAEGLGEGDEVVLLGSIASDKYVAILRDVFGTRLRFPREFVGRGDMSRGGLLLRCVQEGRELDYVPLAGAERHGARPPKLGPRATPPRRT